MGGHVRYRQRWHDEHRFAANPQRRATGREEAQVGASIEQPIDDRSELRKEMLAIVGHDQYLPRRQVLGEDRGGRAALFDQAKRFAAGEGDGIGLANDREIDQRGTVRHRVLEETRDLDRQGGLARTGGSGQGEETAVSVEHAVAASEELRLASDESGSASRQRRTIGHRVFQ